MKTASMVLFLLFTFFGCKHSTEPIERGPVKLDATVNGKTVEYSAGQKIELNLEASVDGGYQWDNEISEPRVVSVEGVTTYTSRTPISVGGSCTASIMFVTNTPGRSTITLIEHRQWEKNVAPLHSLTFTIVVR